MAESPNNLGINDEIPADVVDAVAWRKYQVLRHSIIVRRVSVTASDGTSINLNWFPEKLHRSIKHLSPEEREEIEALYSKRKKVVMVASRQKAIARGSYIAGQKRRAISGRRYQGTTR